VKYLEGVNENRRSKGNRRSVRKTVSRKKKREPVLGEKGRTKNKGGISQED